MRPWPRPTCMWPECCSEHQTLFSHSSLHKLTTFSNQLLFGVINRKLELCKESKLNQWVCRESESVTACLFWPTQAGKEFMSQARSAERRWSKALQHEQLLRKQLEDNLELIAKQMQGLESDARKITQQGSGWGSQISTTSLESSDYHVTSPLASHDGHVTSPQESTDGHFTSPQVGLVYMYPGQHERLGWACQLSRFLNVPCQHILLHM